MGASRQIFSSEMALGGVLNANATYFSFPALAGITGGGLLGVAVQSFSANWGRPVTKLYSLGSKLFYFVVGRPQGDAQLQEICAPNAMMGYFYAQFGNECDVERNNIEIKIGTACETTGSTTVNRAEVVYTVGQALMTSLSFSSTVNDGILNHTAGMMIGSLTYTDQST
jgi:hypothetical protein